MPVMSAIFLMKHVQKSELHAALSHSVSNRIEASDFHLATVESAGHLNRKEKHKYPIGFRLQAEE